MRVAISGPGGCGKTTLALLVATRWEIPYVDEGVAPWLEAERLPGPWSLSSADQLRLQRHVLSHKMEKEAGLPAFVSDRTAVDAISLLTLRLAREGLSVPRRLQDEALAHARTAYDVAILLSHRLAVEIDDVALLDPMVRRRECELTARHYGRLGIPLICVPKLAPGKIAPFVDAELRSFAELRPAKGGR